MTINTVSAGTTAEDLLLQRYEQVGMAHGRAKAEVQDSEGLTFRSMMLGGGGLLGVGAGVAASALAGFSGPIASNPAMALTVGVGAVIGLAAGVCAIGFNGNSAKKELAQTQIAFDAIESEISLVPGEGFASRLADRRTLIATRLAAEASESKLKNQRAMACGFAFGTLTGGS